MAAGDVIFSRDLDAGSDLWDDTALIKAYDDAVSSMKSHLSEKIGDESEEPSPMPSSDKKKAKKKNRKHKKRDKGAAVLQHQDNKSNAGLKPGSHCRAVFTEDGQIYEAVVVAVNKERATCKVCYLGYGNEEEHDIGDILPSVLSDAPSECDSTEWSQPNTPTPPPVFKVPPPPSMPGIHRPRSGLGRGFIPSGHFPPNTDFVMPSMMPPLFPPAMGVGVGMPTFPTMANPHAMPEVPLPPKIDDEDSLENDKDALHSMLISWYMCGYHTGYHQGLKQGNKATTNESKSAK